MEGSGASQPSVEGQKHWCYSALDGSLSLFVQGVVLGVAPGRQATSLSKQGAIWSPARGARRRRHRMRAPGRTKSSVSPSPSLPLPLLSPLRILFPLTAIRRGRSSPVSTTSLQEKPRALVFSRAPTPIDSHHLIPSPPSALQGYSCAHTSRAFQPSNSLPCVKRAHARRLSLSLLLQRCHTSCQGTLFTPRAPSCSFWHPKSKAPSAHGVGVLLQQTEHELIHQPQCSREPFCGRREAPTRIGRDSSTR